MVKRTQKSRPTPKGASKSARSSGPSNKPKKRSKSSASGWGGYPPIIRKALELDQRVWFSILAVGVLLVLGAVVHEYIALFSDGTYGVGDNALLLVGMLFIVFGATFVFKELRVLAYLAPVPFLIGLIYQLGEHYPAHADVNLIFYAIALTLIVLYFMQATLFGRFDTCQNMCLMFVSAFTLFLGIHEMFWPLSIWSIGWLILILALLPLTILSTYLIFTEKHPWLKAHYFVIGALAGMFIIALFLRSYFNFFAATEPFKYVGTDPYYHARTMDWVVDNKEQLIRDPATSYPTIGWNPRPPFYYWVAALIGIVASPFFGGDLRLATTYALEFAPAFWGSLTIIPVYFIGKALFNKKTGLFGALIIAFMPEHIQSTGMGLSDHDPLCLFFVTVCFFFLIKALAALQNTKRPRDVLRINSTSFLYACLAGFALSAVAVSWTGFVYVPAIILIFFMVQLIINSILGRESNGLAMVILTTLLIMLVVSTFTAPYWGASISAFNNGRLPELTQWYIAISAVGLSAVFLPTKKVPWLILLPVTAILSVVAYFLFNYFAPDVAKYAFSGMGYLVKTKVYTTVAEAQKPDLNRLVFGYGVVIYYLCLVGVALLILRYIRRQESKTLLMLVWAIAVIYMPMTAARFMFEPTPVFAILSGWVTILVLHMVDFRAMLRTVQGYRGDFRRAVQRGIKVRHILGAIFIVFGILLPNAFGAIDASIPFEGKGEYDQGIYDAFPVWARPETKSGLWYLGAHGQGYLADYWQEGFEWLATQDADVPIEERPGFIAWWDYGFQCVQLGKHPTIADNFQTGIPPSGNFIVAQNESEAISIFIIRILWSEKGPRGKFMEPVRAVVLNHIGENGTAKLEHILYNSNEYGQEVLDHPEIYGHYTDDIASGTALHPENIVYAAGKGHLMNSYSLEVIVGLLKGIQDVTGKSIRYFGADARMFPISWYNTGIFYAPTVLSDHSVQDFLETRVKGTEVDKDGGEVVPETEWMTMEEFVKWRDEAPPTHSRYVIDYTLVRKPSFFNSMFYRAYIGYSGTEFGSSEIPPIMMPARMLRHFRVVFANSGLRVIKFHEGAIVKGRVTTKDGIPVPGVRITALDTGYVRCSDGQTRSQADAEVWLSEDQTNRTIWQQIYIPATPHDTTITDNDGNFTVIAPFGMDYDGYNVTITASRGGMNDNYRKLMQVEANEVGTETLRITEAAAINQEVRWANFTINAAQLKGKLFWDLDDDVAIETNITVKNTETRVFYNTTSVDGEYKVSVPPGNYDITTNVSGHIIDIARRVTVAENAKKTSDKALKNSTIYGDVRYENGTMTNATISLYDHTNSTYMNLTTVNGTYKFNMLLPGDYTLDVEELNALPFEKVNIHIDEGNETREDIVLTPTIFVNGTIKHDAGYLPNARIILRGRFNRSVEANATGFYSIKLPEGEYSLSVSYQLQDELYLNRTEWAVNLSARSLTRDILLTKALRLRGWVTANESSVPLVDIEIEGADDGEMVPSVSNRSGYYVTYLLPGDYTIRINQSWNESIYVVLENLSVTGDMLYNLTLEKGVPVRGNITYDRTAPYNVKTDGTLRFASDDGVVSTTSVNGSYEIYLPEARNYTLYIEPHGFERYSAGIATVLNASANETFVEHNIWLVPINITISGNLTYNLTPIEYDITIELNATDDVGENITFIAVNGSYQGHLRPGDYDVTINHTALENGTRLNYTYGGQVRVSISEPLVYNISMAERLLVNGTLWLDRNENDMLDIITEADYVETTNTSYVVINELCYNVSANSSQWLELYNPTNSSVNLSGWRLEFNSLSQNLTFPVGTIMEADDYIVLARNLTDFNATWGSVNTTRYFELGFFGEAMDRVWVNDSLQELDSLMYGSGLPEIPAVTLNHSLSRYKGGYDTDNTTLDFYDESVPTPGAENPIPKINETIFKSIETLDDVTLWFGDVQTITDNGSYELYLERGEYHVTVWYREDERVYIYSETLTIAPGSSERDIEPLRAVRVSGNTTWSGEAVAVQVTFANQSVNITEAEDGHYEIYLLPGQNYTVIVTHTTNALKYHNTTILRLDEPAEFNITLDLALTKYVNVTGRFYYDRDNKTDAGGDDVPLPNLIVELSTNVTLANATTDDGGRFYIWLAPGDYNLTVNETGFELYNTSFNTDEPLDPIALTPVNTTLSGYIYYDENCDETVDTDETIDHVTVRFVGLSVTARNITVSPGSKGFYSVALAHGDYFIYTNATYGIYGSLQVRPGEQLSNISLSKFVRVYGRVYYQNGTQENVSVATDLTFSNEAIEGDLVELSPNGTFELYLLPGTYSVYANYERFEHNMSVNYTYSRSGDKAVEVFGLYMYLDVFLGRRRVSDLELHWVENEPATLGRNDDTTYHVILRNRGNSEDTFDVKVTEDLGWNVSVEPATLTLGVNESAELIVDITASDKAYNGENVIEIKASSQNDTRVSKPVSLKVNVTKIPDGIELLAEEPLKGLFVNGSAEFELVLTNIGNNKADIIKLSNSSLPGNWSIALLPAQNVAGGSNTSFTVTLKANENVSVGESVVVSIHAELASDANVTSNNVTLEAQVTLPDLVIRSVTLSDKRVENNDTVNITALVENIGLVPAESPEGFNITFYVGDKVIGVNHTNASIPAGGNYTVYLQWTVADLTDGWHKLKVTITAVNETAFEELDSGNNYYKVKLFVGEEKTYWSLIAFIIAVTTLLIAAFLVRRWRLSKRVRR